MLSAFIVSWCLESPLKHEVQVFEMTSQSIEVDIMIALFTGQLNAAKDIFHHTIEVILEYRLPLRTEYLD